MSDRMHLNGGVLWDEYESYNAEDVADVCAEEDGDGWWLVYGVTRTGKKFVIDPYPVEKEAAHDSAESWKRLLAEAGAPIAIRPQIRQPKAQAIKPIETVYDGYRFRSRLEARWAVFFNAMGIRYDYEPEGFKLPSGKWYLPDFRLYDFWGRNFDSWRFTDEERKAEIKRGTANGLGVLWCDVKAVSSLKELEGREWDDVLKMAEFACPNGDLGFEGAVIENPLIILPNIPETAEKWLWWDYGQVSTFGMVDGDISWPAAICKSKYASCGFCLGAMDGNAEITDDEMKETDRCLAAARQARFEHGETPRV